MDCIPPFPSYPFWYLADIRFWSGLMIWQSMKSWQRQVTLLLGTALTKLPDQFCLSNFFLQPLPLHMPRFLKFLHSHNPNMTMLRLLREPLRLRLDRHHLVGK